MINHQRDLDDEVRHGYDGYTAGTLTHCRCDDISVGTMLDARWQRLRPSATCTIVQRAVPAIRASSLRAREMALCCRPALIY